MHVEYIFFEDRTEGGEENLEADIDKVISSVLPFMGYIPSVDATV